MAKIIGNSLPNIPWQDKPEGYKYPVWRYTENPVTTRDDFFMANSIFNSAIVPFNGKFAGVFRIDFRTRSQKLVVGFSDDGIHWKLNEDIIFDGFDPRLCEIDGYYYLTWVRIRTRGIGTPIGLARTKDFVTFEEFEDATVPVTRNGVLFPRKIGDNYMMLIRPCDKSHTAYGDIFLIQSPDLTYWGKNHLVMRPGLGWESTKVGAGPTPIETDEGWLCFYHGVCTSCNGFTYSMGAAILDKDAPWKVLHRCDSYLLNPQEIYECVGDVQNVVFPCSALVDADTGRIAIYYGAADTVVALAFTTVDETIDYIKKNDSIGKE